MKRTPMKRKAPLKAKAPMKKAGKPKATPIRQSAKGQSCQVRVPGVCNGNPETTVLAHLNGGGMGAKASDIHGAYCCSDCHTFLDGGYANANCTRAERDLYHLEGVIRTQRILMGQGLLEVAA